jgi:hypothetical protein
MAQRVQLTGYQGPRGFKTEQIYDASRQILNQGEQVTNQLERVGQQLARTQTSDLETLAGFSSTLGKFLQDTQQKKNEQEYNLGLAEVLNGSAELPTAIVDNYQKETDILRRSADADTQTANYLEQDGQLAVATEFRTRSKAISGWRAYGQAVGTAKQAASNAQGFFLEFMDRTDPIIPLPDGGLIAPGQATSPSELAAVMNVAQQEFVKQNKLAAINPLVLVEHLAPTLQAVKGQVSSNHLSEQTRKRRETAISDLDSQVNSTFSNLNSTTESMSTDFQYTVELYQTEGGLSRGAASDRALELSLEAIKSLPKDAAQAQLLKLANVAKIKDQPNSIKLGLAYAKQFNQAADAIEDRATALQQRQEAQLNKQAEQAVMLLEKARQDVNLPPQELKALRQQTIQTLGILADKGSTSALQSRASLLAEPANVDYTLYRQYRSGIDQGQRPSAEQIQRDFQAGRLTANMAEELKQYSTSSDRGDFMKQFGSSFKEAVTSKLKNEGAISLNPFGQPLQHTQHVNQTINDLADIAYKVYDAERRKGNTLDDNALNQLIENQLPRVIGRYFQYDKESKSWKTRQISKNPAITPDRVKSTLRGYVPDVGGFNPRTIQLRNLNSGNSVLPKSEVEDNIQRFQSGQPPTARMQTFAASNPLGIVGALTHQAQHHGLDSAVIQNSPQAQELLRLQRLAPRAVQRLATSTDYMSQMLQLQRIAQAEQRAIRMQEAGTPSTGGLKPGSQVTMTDYLKLGLQQGLPPERAILMAAIGMAESSGNTGAHNPDRSSGDNSYGLWQINMIDDLGPSRRAKYGLKSDNDLKDPETNARVMADILKGSGLSAWGAYNDRRYLQYMNEARRAYAQLKQAGGL